MVGRNILSKGSKSQFVRLRAQVQRWEVQFPDMLSSFGCKLSWNNPSQEWHFGGKLVYELFTDTSFFIEVAHGVHNSSPLTYKGSAQHNQMRHMRQHISSRNTWLRRSRLSLPLTSTNDYSIKHLIYISSSNEESAGPCGRTVIMSWHPIRSIQVELTWSCCCGRWPPRPLLGVAMLGVDAEQETRRNLNSCKSRGSHSLSSQ